MHTFFGIKTVKINIATSYLILAIFSSIQLCLQNCKSESVLVVSIFEMQGVLWVRPFTCISDIYSKFVLLAVRSTRITVKVFHEGRPILEGEKWS